MRPLNAMMLLGALLGFIPIAIHLLNRSRYVVEPFGAMMFLRTAIRVRAQRLKIQQWTLLALRVLFFVLLAAALSRPVTQTRYAAGGTQPTTHVVIIDGSASMQRGGEHRSAFTRARATAKRIVEGMKAYDNMLIIWGGKRPRALFPAPSFDQAFLHKVLDDLAPGYETMDAAQAFEQAFFGLQQSTLPRHRIYLLTDGQARGWALEETATWAQVEKHQSLLKVAPAVYILPETADSKIDNLAPTSVHSRSPILDTFRQSEFVVETTNHGKRARRARLTFTVDGTHRTERDLELPPGTTTSHFHHQFRRAGSHYITTEIEDDDFKADNQLTKALHVLSGVPVLVIEGEADPNPFVSDGGLLTAALEATGEQGQDGLFVVTRLEHTDTDKLDITYLQRFRSVVLANVPSLSQQLTFLLEQYVEQGGGLLVALGDRVEPESYTRLYKGGNGLLPGALSERVDADQEVEHPTFSAGNASSILDVFDLSRTRVLNEAKVRGYWRCTPSEDAQVIATFAKSPFLLYKTLGKGRVILWTTSANGVWSTLPFTQDYVPLTQNLLGYLSASVEPPVNLQQGDVLLYSSQRPLSDATPTDHSTNTPQEPPTCTLTLPDQESTELPLKIAGEEWTTQWADTIRPGLYTVTASGLPDRHFAIAMDASEGVLRQATRTERRQAAALVEGEFVSSFQDLSARVGQESGVREWWRVIVYVLLALLCAELIIGWRFSS